jgi:hypothetical protein
VYYDPKDSSKYITIPVVKGQIPQGHVTNPFAPEKPGAMQVTRLANPKDRAMAEIVFHQRDPKGGLQKINLKDRLKQRKEFWTQENERLKEYHSMAAERQQEFLQQVQRRDKAELDEDLSTKLALRAARDVIETNDMMQKQYNIYHKQFTTENANKKFLYPSVVDKETRNVIEYVKDSDGNYVRDPVTGAPVIASSWAVQRDDAERLRQQRATADGMMSKKPYFPVFGKACKNFFSKAEYCQLARMTDKGNPYPETVLRTEKTVNRKLQKLYDKLQNAMRLPAIPPNENRKKVLLELQTLEQAFAQYSTSALYDYPNTLEEADKELQDKEEFESAIKTLEKVTMGKLLQTLAAQKANEMQERQQHADLTQAFGQGAQEIAQQKFPTFPRTQANQPGVYTGVGIGDSEAQARALGQANVVNPAAPSPEEEAKTLFNLTHTEKYTNGKTRIV